MAGVPEGPGFDQPAMREAADMMASMSPEALEQMSSVAASRHVGLQQHQQPSLQDVPAGSQQAVEAMQVCTYATRVAGSLLRLCCDMMPDCICFSLCLAIEPVR